MNKDFKPRILIIDDLRDNLLTLEMNLRTLGAEIVSVTSGQEALIKVQQRDFSLIIIDVQMPEMDGFETAENIRRGRRNQHTPIIFLTAVFQDQQSIDQGYRTGAVDYITKPFNREILLSKARVFLELDRVKHELSESKKLFHDIVQDQTDLICRTDNNFKVLFANRALLITLTSTFEMMQGHVFTQWIDERDLNRWQVLTASLSPNNDVMRLNHTLKISAVRRMTVATVVRALFGSNYELAGYQVVMRDISGEVKSNDELIRARRQADERLIAKAAFVAAIGQSATESTDVLIREIDRLMPLQDSGIQRQAEHVAFLAKELQQTLHQFQQLNNLEAMRALPQLSWFHPRQLVAEVITRAHAAKNWKYGFRVEMADTRLTDDELKGNESTIGDLLFHLLMTTCFFAQNGTLHILMKPLPSDKNSIRLGFNIQSADLHIPGQILQYLSGANGNALHENMQLPATMLLHLGFVKVLSEKLHTQITFVENEGREVDFGFRILLESKNHEELCEGKELKILVVEDNKLNQQVVATTLRRNGHSFELADNGQMAIDKAKASSFDIIIMDIQMPLVDGYEATRQIRTWEQQHSNRKPSVIIALTANATREDQEKCHEVGMDSYMTKPFRMNELTDVIQKFAL
ncbi:MAG: response regulator [Clostridia bacterium]|nr:response regulator [Clostridia bacterium]